jgi:hypothetical protein
MAKSKDRSEVEYLRGLVKDLKSQVRNLKKEVSRSSKRQHREQDLEEIVKEIQFTETQEAEQAKGVTCPNKCKAPMEAADLGIRTIHTCTSCGHRITVKHGKKEGI